MRQKRNSYRPYEYVDPLIDTGKPKTRWVFFQSASRPFGMIQLSPDTDIEGTWGTGYCYNSNKIKCFSHIHSWQLSALPVLPFLGVFTENIKNGYEYSHETEIVKPGYHKVHLTGCGIEVELTASKRVGVHKYTFPENKVKGIMLDLGMSLGPCKMSGSKIKKKSDVKLQGYIENAPTVRRPKPCKIFFNIEFSIAFNDIEITENKCVLIKFSAETPSIIMMKVAISYVSAGQAGKNMKFEINHWDFNKVVEEAREEWSGILDRIIVKGGTHKQKIKFYTDLWRSTFGGHIINDVDGKYCDMTGEVPVIRQVPINSDGKLNFEFISNADIFWGAHWSLSILWDLVYPDIKSDYCKSLIEMYKYGGLIPRGPSGGNYTFVMSAAHSGAFIISAYMKGIRDFDIESAYEGIRKNAFPGGLMSKSGYEHNTCLDGGIETFIEKGYIAERERKSQGFHCDGASQTIEYSFDHWCTAQLAKQLGYEEDYLMFLKRSQNYRNMFDSKSKFMRPKNKDGSFIEPFNPLELKGFCEGNGWGYTFYVPHDIPGLIDLMGGKKTFVKKLDYAFNKAGDMNYYAAKPELKRNKAYINYGNENTRFTAALFNHAGMPWLTQKWSRIVKQSLFSSTELKGFCEDDDCGLSAGTSILLALGLFDIKGGAYENPEYEIASPLFDEIKIKLNKKYYSGKEFTMIMNNNSPKSPYIKSGTFNGMKLTGFTISHSEVVKGGKLVLNMSGVPNKT